MLMSMWGKGNTPSLLLGFHTDIGSLEMYVQNSFYVKTIKETRRWRDGSAFRIHTTTLSEDLSLVPEDPVTFSGL